MKRRLIAIAVALTAAALIYTAAGEEPRPFAASGQVKWLAVAIGCVLVAASLLVLLNSLGSGAGRAVMPLNWFLPALRKERRQVSHPHGVVTTWIQRLTPTALRSDPVTKRRGLIRKGLHRLGVSWLSTPVRRIVQCVCFIVFLVLFFWVCWPYDAHPEPPGRIAREFRLLEVGADDGSLQFEAAAVPSWISPGCIIHVVDDSAPGSKEGYLAPVIVQEVAGQRIAVRPEGDLQDAQVDRLLSVAGPWAIHEREPSAWPTHYADNLDRKEFIPADLFLLIDPLVSFSTAIASRSWVWSLVCAGMILVVCVLIPRGFCGYVCPLGTLIDLFDWMVGRRVVRYRVAIDGWWVHVKYYILLGTLICAVFGVLVSGYVAAIPVITRGMLFLVEPLQSGMMRGWHLIPPVHLGHIASVVLFFAVLGLGLLRPRFWCKYVCPSGATFSLANLLRISERKVESTCINCNKCVEVCPFDAIKPDFTTRVTDCTLCQTCGGICPTHAIKFVERWNAVELKVGGDPPTGDTSIGRRGFLSLTAGTAAAAIGGVGLAAATRAFGPNLDNPNAYRPVRPPGSVPEQEFLQMCIRCGECFKACPNNVLQAEGLEQGLDGLWTPFVAADWAGCESSCNACGHVCPTGAIRALPMNEKKVARMGLAIVNEVTCLPYINREACDLCVDECNAAGYEAIEYTRVHTQLDESGIPIGDSGFLAPVVIADKCVGCGLCQTRCYGINVKANNLLHKSAIVIKAGPGREDRLMSGSYIELREVERKRRSRGQVEGEGSGDFFIPNNEQPSKSEPSNEPTPEDPFGVGT